MVLRTDPAFPERSDLLLVVGFPAHQEFLPVDQVTVEIRSVDTCEFCLTVNREPADAAHTGAVDHDRVHADHGFNSERTGDIRNPLHLESAAIGDNSVGFDFLVPENIRDFRHMTLIALGTVAGDREISVDKFPEPVFPVKEIA